MISLDALPELCQAVLTGSRQILAEQHFTKDKAYTHKANGYDILSDYDVAIERQLVTMLASLTPDVRIFGEELNADAAGEEYWLLDPIDGTIHFARNIPFSMLMVCLVQNGAPVLTVLVNILTADEYYAYSGGGAYKNGERIHVSTRADNESLVLIETKLSVADNAQVYQQIGSHFKTMNLCCAGYEFCLVAEGAVEARVVFDGYGKVYDFAPGALLVQEAGGYVADIVGQPYTTDTTEFIVASNRGVYDALKACINAKGVPNETAL